MSADDILADMSVGLDAKSRNQNIAHTDRFDVRVLAATRGYGALVPRLAARESRLRMHPRADPRMLMLSERTTKRFTCHQEVTRSIHCDASLLRSLRKTASIYSDHRQVFFYQPFKPFKMSLRSSLSQSTRCSLRPQPVARVTQLRNVRVARSCQLKATPEHVAAQEVASISRRTFAAGVATTITLMGGVQRWDSRSRKYGFNIECQ